MPNTYCNEKKITVPSELAVVEGKADNKVKCNIVIVC